ncbi:MAG: hypothetical protein QOE59_1142, partial [Actinomycetota bacterium]|nr:hypothetical protein [Actinomycetota bacterium]
MAEAGTPQPDGPRPPTPRPRGDRGRDPAALAAWRRVAEQRRKAGDKATSPRGASTVEPAVAEPPVVEPPIVERPTAARPALGRPATATPAADRPATEPGTDRQAATAEPATDRPAAAEPAADRPAARPAPGRPTAERPGGPRPAVGRPAGPPPVVDRPGAQDPATPARPAPTGAGDDLVRAVQDDHAHGEPTRPDSPPAPATARDESAPASSRPGSDGGPAPVGRLHDALLGLAGRLDDDALTSVREMVAAEDDAEAAELLGGCLLAGGIGLTAQERAVLRPWFTAARVDPELLGMLPSDTGALDRAVHRFVTSAPDRAPGVPLARAARRLSGVVAVRESWRVTPAGSAPGPVPHRVVLVETVGPDDCDHVVHHLAHAARALDDTSVEVFAQGAGLPAYHRAALAVARPLVADDATAPPAAPSAPPAAARSAPPAAARPAPSAPIRSTPPTVARPTPPRPAPPVQRLGAPEDEETWRTVADAGTSRTGPAPVAVPPEPTGVEDDADEPEHVDLDEPELMDLDEPEPEPEPEPADPDEADEAPVALAEPPRPDRTEPAR